MEKVREGNGKLVDSTSSIVAANQRALVSNQKKRCRAARIVGTSAKSNCPTTVATSPHMKNYSPVRIHRMTIYIHTRGHYETGH